jgi:hypothetical protein
MIGAGGEVTGRYVVGDCRLDHGHDRPSDDLAAT